MTCVLKIKGLLQTNKKTVHKVFKVSLGLSLPPSPSKLSTKAADRITHLPVFPQVAYLHILRALAEVQASNITHIWEPTAILSRNQRGLYTIFTFSHCPSPVCWYLPENSLYIHLVAWLSWQPLRGGTSLYSCSGSHQGLCS